MTKPLYKKFSFDNEYFVYDSATNNIINILPDTFKILDIYFEAENSNDCHVKAQNLGISDASLHKSMQEITHLAKNNIFSRSRPLIGLGLPSSAFEEVYDAGLAKLTLVVTEDCNLRCKYCTYSGEYNLHRVHNKKYMSFDIAREAVDFYIAHSKRYREIWLKYKIAKENKLLRNRSIGFYGGEPFLNSKLIREVVNYAKSHDSNIMFHMTSNLTINDREFIDFIIDNNFSLSVSLDGPQEIHDRNRLTVNEEATHERVMANLDYIQSIAGSDYIKNKILYNVTLTHPVDFIKIDDFFRNTMRLPAGKLNMSLIRKGHRTFDQKIMETRMMGYEDMEMRLATSNQSDIQNQPVVCGIFNRKINKYLERNIFKCGWPKHEITHSGPCLPPGGMRMYVTADGKIYPCERVPNIDYFILGDIWKGFDTEKIICNIKDYFDFTKDMCQDCWAYRLCTACYQTFLNKNVDKNSRYDESIMSKEVARGVCQNIKSGIEKDLVDFCKICVNNKDILSFFTNEKINEISYDSQKPVTKPVA